MKSTVYNYLLILIILFVSFVVMLPGLDGQFIFDDFLNLGTLREISDKGYGFFVFGGISGVLGRPVSLLTFALQHNYWPGDPYPFKLVNLLIHITNGFLVWLLARLLCNHVKMDEKQCIAIPAITCFLWTLHPIHQSTVFYVVQRMNLLAVFFTLSGILLYLHYRKLVRTDNHVRILFWLTITYSVLLSLAVFSKENGILLPLYILVIEYFIIREKTDVRWFRIWKMIFLWGPLICLCAYLIITFPNDLASYEDRSYTMLERLYTEPYVLLDYISKIIYPRSGVYGLINDNYIVFKSLFDSPMAITSVTIVVGLIAYAMIARNKSKILAFSIIWYLAGQVLESTYLNLELYFEHRNYLPSFGIIFLISSCCYFVWKKFKNKLVVSLLMGLLAITYITVARSEASVWGNPVLQAESWYRHHPGSLRALDLKGNTYLAAGFVRQGADIYEEFKDKYPDNLYPEVKLIFINSCVLNSQLTPVDWNELYQLSARAGHQNQAFLLELDTLTSNVIEGKCNGINIRNLIRLMVTMAGNPLLDDYMPALHQFAALLSVKIGEMGAAYNNIERAVKTRPNIENSITEYQILMKMGDKKQAGDVLDEIGKMLANNFRISMVYSSIYKELRDAYHE